MRKYWNKDDVMLRVVAENMRLREQNAQLLRELNAALENMLKVVETFSDNIDNSRSV
jgi:hypothetical protein